MVKAKQTNLAAPFYVRNGPKGVFGSVAPKAVIKQRRYHEVCGSDTSFIQIGMRQTEMNAFTDIQA